MTIIIAFFRPWTLEHFIMYFQAAPHRLERILTRTYEHAKGEEARRGFAHKRVKGALSLSL